MRHRVPLMHRMSPAVRRTHFLALLMALVCGVAINAVGAVPNDESDIDVRASQSGDVIIVDVDLVVRATQDEVWKVLTDYDHMAQFVANLEESAIVARNGNTLDVMQKGTARYGLLSFPFESVRRVRLTPSREIHSTIISGDMAGSEITTRIATNGDMAHVSVRSRFIPTRWIPPVIGPQVIASETRKQWFTLREEVLKRRANP